MYHCVFHGDYSVSAAAEYLTLVADETDTDLVLFTDDAWHHLRLVLRAAEINELFPAKMAVFAPKNLAMGFKLRVDRNVVFYERLKTGGYALSEEFSIKREIFVKQVRD